MRISKNQIKFIRSLSQKKVRDAEQLFLAEGEKCVRELLQSFEPYLIASSIPLSGVSALEASPMEIEQMSQLRHPQGVIAAFRMPNPIIAESADELTLALDGIQDPGNLGTIIRTADWFGISNIVCSADTVDCWNPKVVQATMGALARVRVQYTDLYSFIQRSTQSKADDAAGKCGSCPVYGTLLDGKNMYLPNAIPCKNSGIIIMGNEGNGISPAIRHLITHPLFIPSYPADRPTSESLNVAIATAIVLAEFRR